MAINLDLLEQCQEATQDLISAMTALKYQTPFNSDENAALERSIENMRLLAIVFDGIFFRHDNQIETQHPKNILPFENDRLVVPLVFPKNEQKKVAR